MGQSVGISFNCETNTTHMQLYDENFKRYFTSQMVLSGEDTGVLLEEIPNIDTAFMKILAGDWELVERKDLTVTMKNLMIPYMKCPMNCRLKLTGGNC